MAFWARSRPRLRRPPSPPRRLVVEPLEARNLLSAAAPFPPAAPVPEVEANDTLDQAQLLGDLAGRVDVAGALGGDDAPTADVDWYGFTLAQPAEVTLTAGGAAAVVLGLYNSEPSNWAALYNPTGHRLLAQAVGPEAALGQLLPAGTYYVAVSGDGNRDFHPFVAGSGYPGAGGDYALCLTAAPLGLDPAAGPAVLAMTPEPGSALDRSPLLVRLALSKPLDPNTVIPDLTALLLYNPTGDFGDGNDQNVFLGGFGFSDEANELQLAPLNPLAPGHYRVVLAGDTTTWWMVLTDWTGQPLGADADHPFGQDFTADFQVTAAEGGAGADDTPATARRLGELAAGTTVRVTGAVGDDPAYNLFDFDPFLFNPAADVDLYHFQVAGPGRHALTAEVLAGRVGSPLDPGLTLFRRDEATGQLVLVAVNDNTLNDLPAANGFLPLFTDAVLFTGLVAGDYYLAVSGTGNLPNPALGLEPGTFGVFDPAVSHSGMGGFTTGDYVLSLRVEADAEPPRVAAVSPPSGAWLGGPPTRLDVWFSEVVNLQQLAYQTFELTFQTELEAVYVEGADGARYYPRLESYDEAGGRATFLLLDGLADGVYHLHLSGAGPLGLTDLAGRPLAGNDPSGDYVARFTVDGPERGTDGDPLLWAVQEPNDDPAAAQPLGVLFPRELQQGVVVRREAGGAADAADAFRFEVLQGREYIFGVNGIGLPAGLKPLLFDAAGSPVKTVPQGRFGAGVRAYLTPGVYVVQVGGWDAAGAADVAYELRLSLGTSTDNPAPLTVGPAPAIRLRLVTTPPPPGGTAPPPPAAGVPGPVPGPPSTGPVAPTPVVTLPPVVVPPVAVPPSVDVPASPGGVAGPVSPPSSPAGGTSLGLPSGLLLTRVLDGVGVRGTPGVDVAGGSDRVVVRGAQPPLAHQLVQLTTFTQLTAQADDAPLPASADLAEAILQYLRSLQTSLQSVIEVLSRLRMPLPSPAAAGALLPGESAEAGDDEELEPPAEAVVPAAGAQADGPDWVQALAAAAAGGAVLSPRRKRQAARPAPRAGRPAQGDR